MKMRLSQDFVVEGLSIKHVPVIKGERVTGRKTNPKRASYIVFDTHRDAPRGFGVKVGAGKKTYIVQRRVGDKVFKATVQDVADGNIETARKRAADMARVMVERRANPNAIRRNQWRRAEQWELGQILRDYRAHMESRVNKPAKPATLRQIDRAVALFEDWDHKNLKEIRPGDVKAKFNRLIESWPQREAERKQKQAEARAKERGPNYRPRKVPSRATGTLQKWTGRTSVEMGFRWAMAAVRRAIQTEQLEALTEQRAPEIAGNPFLILPAEQMLRGKERLEKDIEKNRSRNPLGILDGTLGEFLEALWPRFAAHHAGAQYLLLTLLLGARRNETAALMWRDRLTDDEALQFSWVELGAAPRVVFHETKNRTTHELPVPAGAAEILKRRRDESTATNRYVFPSRAKGNSRKAAHYSDPKSVLTYIRDQAIANAEAKKKKKKPFGNPALIGRVRPHDLRRTFGRVAEEHASERMVKRLLNHKRPGETTERYMSPEWLRVAEVIQKIEVAMLETFPKAYNLLLPRQHFPRLAE